MDTVYRAKLGIDTSSDGGHGSWRLYDTFDKLAEDLTQAHLDMLAKQDRGLAGKLARLWRRERPNYPRVRQVFAVEQHLNNEWVPVEYGFVAPSVWLAGN